ncbi:unnamed protein product [Prorocentrum cordatum]|uniref:uDENN domain-containing protein n=1 Tax=Prorocentrum cordatum TaxID=2364126 RepID=A0ABN9SX93_9DINO|nr:unnamed protein product [Polarella glacialis]
MQRLVHYFAVLGASEDELGRALQLAAEAPGPVRTALRVTALERYPPQDHGGVPLSQQLAALPEFCFPGGALLTSD